MHEPESESSPAFLKEGAIMLQLYCGIEPYENACDAAEAIWESVCKLAERKPAHWVDLHGWFDHPQVRATFAYYKAIGPWRVKHGYPASPAELPEPGDVVSALAKVALAMPVGLPVHLPPQAVEKPLPAVILLTEEHFENHSRFSLKDPMLGHLITAAEDAVRYSSIKEQQVLDDRVFAVARAVKLKRERHVDVYVSGLKDFSSPARKIVHSWMQVVRNMPEVKGLILYFKFDAKL